MTKVRCPYCFVSFKATRAITATRQRDDHVANAATRCVVYMETQKRLHGPIESIDLAREAIDRGLL